jgi:DNA polymerase III subunit epsilon
MQLQLQKPLIIFDLETTGIQVSTDRIVDIFLIKINVDGSELTWYKRLNPTIPIPDETSKIHGIYDDDVVDSPTFDEVAKDLNEFIGNADFGGFNSNRFDFPMLVEEFYRAGIDFETEKRKFLDAQRIFHIKEPRNLAAAYSFYCNEALENAHSAEADTRATWEIIQSQLQRYTDLEPNVDFLHNFSGQNEFVDLAGRIKRNSKGEPCIAFGKHRGKAVTEVFTKEPSYFDWMMRGDFPENTKRVITRLMLSMKNTNN